MTHDRKEMVRKRNSAKPPCPPLAAVHRQHGGKMEGPFDCRMPARWPAASGFGTTWALRRWEEQFIGSGSAEWCWRDGIF